VENQLAQQLGVSRPPLREALRRLERTGLVTQEPRRGASVATLTLQDVYEIFSLRGELERMAMDLAIPLAEPSRMARCEEWLAKMEDAAARDDRAGVTETAFEFHASVIGLSGHRRLEEFYRSPHLQLELCFVLNQRARAGRETLSENAARHRVLLEVIKSADLDRIHAEFRGHGDRTFLEGIEHELPGHTPEALAWLASVRH
jgi:DNA-binding GntR family transcriptional regulator